MQDKIYAILAAMFQKQIYFVKKKKTIPGTWIGVFMWDNFHPCCWDVNPKNQDLSTCTTIAFHNDISKLLLRKEWLDEISETEPTYFTILIWRGPQLLCDDPHCSYWL